MSTKSYTSLLRKESGAFKHLAPSDKTTYDEFLKRLPDDTLVEIYLEVQKDDATLAQLARVHAMIRELALHIGETFEDMKLMIKKRAGLCIEKQIDGERFLYCKSFGTCSKEELSLCIEAMKQIAYQLDYPIQ